MKMILAGAGVVLLLCTALFILNERNNNLELQRNAALAKSASLQAQIDSAKLREKENAQTRSNYLTALQANRESIDRLSADLSARPERVYIRASCPTVPEADGSRRIEAETIEVDASTRQNIRRLEQDLLVLRRDLGEVEAWIDYCYETVKNRSSETN